MALSPEPGPSDVWADVSERLRQARTAKGLTLRALAGGIGVSPSLISQIETGKVKPSINTLYALAVELDISVDEILFGALGQNTSPPLRDTEPFVGVQRAGARATVELASGVTWERLTGASEAGIDFLYLTYEPGSQSVPSDSAHRHAGREWGYVISGTLEVEVEGARHRLHAGDSIAYFSSDTHRLFNPGDDDMRAVWFILGRRGGFPAA